MTIKQLGGIFGRNPTFNDVDVEGDQSITGDLDVSGDVSIGQSGSVTNLNLLRASANYVNASSSGGYFIFRTGGTTKKRLEIQDDGDVYFFDTAGTTAQMIYTASNSNLSFPSGSGIDFSATSGTGTSELFDDYEEGTWTPAFSGGDYTFTYNKQKGSYTKIGNRVYVDCVLYIHPTTAPSGTVDGNLSVTGLPYTFNKQNDVESVGSVIHFKQLFMTTAETIGYRVTDGGSSFQMYDTLATTYPELNYVQASDVNANSRIRLQFSYPTNG